MRANPVPWRPRRAGLSPKAYAKKAVGKVESNWFSGGKTNICYNALDRHVKAGHGDQIALYHEANDEGEELKAWTYAEVLKQMPGDATAKKEAQDLEKAIRAKEEEIQDATSSLLDATNKTNNNANRKNKRKRRNSP